MSDEYQQTARTIKGLVIQFRGGGSNNQNLDEEIESTCTLSQLWFLSESHGCNARINAHEAFQMLQRLQPPTIMYAYRTRYQRLRNPDNGDWDASTLRKKWWIIKQ